MKSLITQLLLGNPQAVSTFYQTYAPRILRYLRRKLPGDIAEEILSDVFLDAVDALPTLQKETNLQAWLYQIAHHKTVDYYRKKKLKSFLFSQVPYLEILAAEMHEPEFILEKDKLRERIERAMHTLSQKYQHILKLHYEDELPVKSIALEMELTFKATESMLFRARQNFIKAYERA